MRRREAFEPVLKNIVILLCAIINRLQNKRGGVLNERIQDVLLDLATGAGLAFVDEVRTRSNLPVDNIWSWFTNRILECTWVPG